MTAALPNDRLSVELDQGEGWSVEWVHRLGSRTDGFIKVGHRERPHYWMRIWEVRTQTEANYMARQWARDGLVLPDNLHEKFQELWNKHLAL